MSLCPWTFVHFFPVITVDLPLKKATKPLQISIFHAVCITSKATWWCKSLPLTSKPLFPKLFPRKILLHEISPWGGVWPFAPSLGCWMPWVLLCSAGTNQGFPGLGCPASSSQSWWMERRGGEGGGTAVALGGHTKSSVAKGTITGGTCTLWVEVGLVWTHKICQKMGRFCWVPSHPQGLGNFSSTHPWETFILPRCSSRHSETFPLAEEFCSFSLLLSSPFLFTPHLCELRQTPKIWNVSLQASHVYLQKVLLFWGFSDIFKKNVIMLIFPPYNNSSFWTYF